MIMSLFMLFDNRYASRISEYVIPPATKTRSRCLISWGPPGLAARCQLGFALRNDVAPVEGAAFRLGAADSDGWSLTYGKRVGSSLLFR
jgi:hypothetical protein